MTDTSKFLMAFVVVVSCMAGFHQFQTKSDRGMDEKPKKEMVVAVNKPLIMEPTKEIRSVQEEEIGCDEGETLKTMSTHWERIGKSDKQASLSIYNDTNQTIFLKLTDITSSNLIETIVLMPADGIDEKIYPELIRMEIQTGSVWCNRLKGWRDGIKTVLKEPLNTTKQNSRYTLRISRNKINTEFSIAFIENDRKNQTDSESFKTKKLSEEEGTKTSSEFRVVKQNVNDGQGVLTGTNENKVADAKKKKIDYEVVPFEQNRKDFRAGQDWHDVPNRTMKIVTREGNHFINGTVGEDAVEFKISDYGYSAISEELAERNGAYGCNRGSWVVDGTHRNACLKMIQRLVIGDIELDHVMVVVTNGIRQPILGVNLLRKPKFFTGPDGDYIEVGPGKN